MILKGEHVGHPTTDCKANRGNGKETKGAGQKSVKSLNLSIPMNAVLCPIAHNFAAELKISIGLYQHDGEGSRVQADILSADNICRYSSR